MGSLPPGQPAAWVGEQRKTTTIQRMVQNLESNILMYSGTFGQVPGVGHRLHANSASGGVYKEATLAWKPECERDTQQRDMGPGCMCFARRALGALG